MATKTEVTIQLRICKDISLCTYVLQPVSLAANFEAAKKPVLAALKEKYGINAKESDIKVFSPTGAKSLRDISSAPVSNQVLQVNLISTALKKEFETLQTQAPSPSLPSEAESSSSDSEDDYTLELDEAILMLHESIKENEIMKNRHNEDMYEMQKKVDETTNEMHKIQEIMNKMRIKHTGELNERTKEFNNVSHLLNNQKHTTRNYRNRVKKTRKANDKILLRALANTVQEKIKNGRSTEMLSEGALSLLRKILYDGNIAAHPKDIDEIQQVIKRSPEKPLLEELFEFAYGFSLE